MKISVIVPIYNVEKFIERLARSLFEQSFESLEYIFIDDCSPDNSMSILEKLIEEYPFRKASIKFIRHSENRGLPSARNSGLAIATGEYIYHCDSDDYIEPDMLALMYAEAIKKKADYVWCDFFLTFEKSERHMVQPSYPTPIDALKGVLTGQMKYNVWNKLVKHDIYIHNNIYFPDGLGMGEDMTMIKLLACSKSVAYVKKPLYHYVRLNTTAFTHEWQEHHLTSLLLNTNSIILFLQEKIDISISDYLEFFKLNNKYPFLISSQQSMYTLWRNTFPESNTYILRNPAASYRSKMLQIAAMRKWDWILRMHYFFIYKVVYGCLYR